MNKKILCLVKSRLKLLRETYEKANNYLLVEPGRTQARWFLFAFALFAGVISNRLYAYTEQPVPIDFSFERFNLTMEELAIYGAPWAMWASATAAGLASTSLLFDSFAHLKNSFTAPLVRFAMVAALASVALLAMSGFFNYRFWRTDFVSMQAEGSAAAHLRMFTPFEDAVLLGVLGGDLYAKTEESTRVRELVREFEQFQPTDKRAFQAILRASIIGDARRQNTRYLLPGVQTENAVLGMR